MNGLSPVQKVCAVLALVAFGVAARYLPHWPNMTPVTAILFAGAAILGARWSLPAALGALALSDALIGLYDWRLMVAVYGSFALVWLLSLAFARAQKLGRKVALLAGASLLFFITTNAAVWAFSPLYPHTLAGLFESYAMGLPFLRNMLIGDFVYTGLLLGAFSSIRVPLARFARPAISHAA